jgi:hypothetical protein
MRQARLHLRASRSGAFRAVCFALQNAKSHLRLGSTFPDGWQSEPTVLQGARHQITVSAFQANFHERVLPGPQREIATQPSFLA